MRVFLAYCDDFSTEENAIGYRTESLEKKLDPTAECAGVEKTSAEQLPVISHLTPRSIVLYDKQYSPDSTRERSKPSTPQNDPSALLAQMSKLEEEMERIRLTVTGDNKRQKPIKFKDAVGRKFSFPFHLCSTWEVCHPMTSS